MTARGDICNLALALMEIFCDLWLWQVEAKIKLRYYSFGNEDFFVRFLGQLICVWQIVLKVMEMNRNNFTLNGLLGSIFLLMYQFIGPGIFRIW